MALATPTPSPPLILVFGWRRSSGAARRQPCPYGAELSLAPMAVLRHTASVDRARPLRQCLAAKKREMMSAMQFRTIDSPVGPLTLAGKDHRLMHLWMVDQTHEPSHSGWERDDKAFSDAVEQLDAYFAGERREFDLELDLVGTNFQRRVWEALLTIPYGETRSYGDIAEQIGSPGAFRAIGQRSVVALIDALADGRVVLHAGCDWDRARQQLAALPGIGPWTAEVIAMRGLGDPDAFPATDLRCSAGGEAVGAARRQPCPHGAELSLAPMAVLRHTASVDRARPLHQCVATTEKRNDLRLRTVELATGEGEWSAGESVQVVTHPLRLAVQGHVRHVMHAVERILRVLVQRSEQSVEVVGCRTGGRHELEGLTDSTR